MQIVDVQICSDKDDVLLTTARGQCIRFRGRRRSRVQGPRDSMGVRGVTLADGEIRSFLWPSSSFDASPAERLRLSRAATRACGEGTEAGEAERRMAMGTAVRSPFPPEHFGDAPQQVILTVSENGYGNRTSSFKYRVTGRGGKGVVAMAVNDRNGALVASFPVEDSDEIMLVTDGGQLIRVPVGRNWHRRPHDPGRHRVEYPRTRSSRIGETEGREEGE